MTIRFHWVRQTTEEAYTYGEDTTEPPMPVPADWYIMRTDTPELESEKEVPYHV